MAQYDRSSIVTFSSIIVGLANLLTFLCFLTPTALLGAKVYQAHDFEGLEGFGRALLSSAQNEWMLLAGASVLAALVGYLVTLILRVFGQLLLCAVQIEQNTRSVVKPA